MTVKCRLCLKEEPLVDSQIIPKFYYKPLKKEEGHYKIISSDPAKRDLKGQKGVTEYLLCAKCDNERLGRNEKHLAEVIQTPELQARRSDGFLPPHGLHAIAL